MIEIEKFELVYNPDLSEVSELIQRSWPKPCWKYDKDLLSTHINRPSGDPDFTVGHQDNNGKIISFLAYMPFNVNFNGRDQKAVLASFWTIEPEFKKKKIAAQLHSTLLNKSIDEGYDLFLAFTEADARSYKAAKSIFAGHDRNLELVNKCSYYASTNELIQSKLPLKISGRTRLYQKDDNQQAGILLNHTGNHTDLYKIIPQEDIEYILNDRPHTKTFIYEKDNEIKGLINLLLLEVVQTSGEIQLNVYFEHIAFGTLGLEEQEQFLGEVLLLLQEDNFYTALIPHIGYVDLKPFKQFSFRMAPRQLYFLVAALQEGAYPNSLPPVDSFFIDIY